MKKKVISRSGNDQGQPSLFYATEHAAVYIMLRSTEAVQAGTGKRRYMSYTWRTLESAMPPTSWHLPWSCHVLYTKGAEGWCKNTLPVLGTKTWSTKFLNVPSAAKGEEPDPWAQTILDIQGKLRTLIVLAPGLHPLVWLHPAWFQYCAIKWPKNTWGEHLHVLDPNSDWTLWKICERLACDSSLALRT